MASELLRTLPVDLTVFWVVVYKICTDVSETPVHQSPGPTATTGNVCGFNHLMKNQATRAHFRFFSDSLLNTQPTIPRCVVSFSDGVVMEGTGLTDNEHTVTVQIMGTLSL
jgi:hypothetical protein